MIIITLQRKKCIGCNYCAELDPEHFRMSKKDGKTVLLHSTNNKGFYTVKDQINENLENAEAASTACPVNIISVKQK